MEAVAQPAVSARNHAQSWFGCPDKKTSSRLRIQTVESTGVKVVPETFSMNFATCCVQRQDVPQLDRIL